MGTGLYFWLERMINLPPREITVGSPTERISEALQSPPLVHRHISQSGQPMTRRCFRAKDAPRRYLGSAGGRMGTWRPHHPLNLGAPGEQRELSRKTDRVPHAIPGPCDSNAKYLSPAPGDVTGGKANSIRISARARV